MINEEEEPVEGSYEEVEEVTSSVEDTEDGGAIVTLDDGVPPGYSDHFDNLVEILPAGELATVASNLIDQIGRDKEAREKRDKLYEEGIRRTGLGDDAPGGAEFSGATKVVHPLLVESCVDFSARVTKELLPASGPVKTKIVGESSTEKLRKATRKADFMNWQLTEQMGEFRSEIEQLSTQTPLGGAQYLKMYWNPNFKRAFVEFIAIDDMYLPFAATNFYSAERRTHVQYVTEMEYTKRVNDGMYVDQLIGSPLDPDYSLSSEANDKIEGREQDAYNEDGLRKIFETYTFLDIEGELSPYIISIDDSSGKVLAVYRNWEENDESRKELDWIVEFPFIPWRGAYPIGLTHLIGGLSAGATGALRALLDSAHINNIPTMLKLKGGPNGQTLNLAPTEVAEIDGGLVTDDIRKLAMPLPFSPPSSVLYQLLGFLVDAGKGVVQTSFEKLADTSQQQPVGTTMALIEQGMAVYSSIHTRFHSSMSRVLKVLHRINGDYLTEEIIKQQYAGFDIKPEDFDGPIDIIPVSDPHVFSETQRFAQMQAVLQRSAALPQLYDPRKTEEMFLRQMKMNPDDVLVKSVGSSDMDPVSENVAATMGQPIYVIPKQQHSGHLQIHIAFLQSQMFGGNPVMQKTLIPRMVPHLRDHLLNYYMVQSMKGIKLAEESGKIAKDNTVQEKNVIALVQQNIEQEFSGIIPILNQLDQMAQQLSGPQQGDPALQIANINAELQKSLQQMKTQIEQMKIQTKQQTDAAELELKRMKLEMDNQTATIKLQLEDKKIEQNAVTDKEEILAKEAMNSSDNQTALIIAGAQIDAGDRPTVSSGTGINPNP